MSRIRLDRLAVRTVGQNAGRQAVSTVVGQALPMMKRAAPKSPAHLSGSGKPKPGVRLSEAIKPSAMKVTAFEVSQRIESLKDYTLSLHNGARRHRIPLRTGGKVLKFKWRTRIPTSRGMRRVRPSQFSYFVHVMHPGIRKPVRFMTTPLAAVARANNFHYRSNFTR